MQQYEIIVIGGGIAGLSAALTAARLGRKTAILTGGVPGGELLNIENVDGIPGHENGIAGFELCPIAQEQADAAGAIFLMDNADTITETDDQWQISTTSGDLAARALILATGARVAQLGVPGEKEFAGKGISHCATCDGPLLRGKVVVVAGGGDSGMQEALTLAQFTEKVLLIERSGQLSGQTPYVDAVNTNSRIEIITGAEVIGITGTDKVEQVTLRDISSNEERTIDAQGVFSFVGLRPDVAAVAELVELAEDGRIAVDAALSTSKPGIFAAGNVRAGNSWRAAGALGDGATAALSADRYLAALASA